jgi:hypothetical protein
MQRQVGNGTKLDAKMWTYYGNNALTIENRYGLYYYQNSIIPPISLDEPNPLGESINEEDNYLTIRTKVPVKKLLSQHYNLFLL